MGLSHDCGLLNGARIRFLAHPAALKEGCAERIGTGDTQGLGSSIVHTDPQRTLVDGSRRPRLVGGLEEQVESAGGFGVLDLELLERSG